ncbi:MAG: PucR family transcriptional regulator [Chloroflexi bacterium]|nr:PucR family transcriptional regulator [Chloroflexota bacterium]
MTEGIPQLKSALQRLGGLEAVKGRLDRVLESVRAYDAKTNSELEATLRAWVERGGSIAETADALFLHRNSVLYRIQRIEELSGIDLRDRQTRQVLLTAFTITDPQATAGKEEAPHEDKRQKPASRNGHRG